MQSKRGMRIVEFDHLVLLCADVERSLAFYTQKLGLADERVDEWRRGDVGFPSVRVNEHTILDLFAGEPTGANMDHFCMVVEDTDLDSLATSGEFDVVRGPVEVFGARGMGRSVYVRDPDGHQVELRTYPAG